MKSVNKKITKLIRIKDPVETKKKPSQQQGEGIARIQLEQLKNKFINILMRNGEKGKAFKLLAESLNKLEKKTVPLTTIENKNSDKEKCENRVELFQFYTKKDETEKNKETEISLKKKDIRNECGFAEKNEKDKANLKRTSKVSDYTKSLGVGFSLGERKGQGKRYEEQKYYNDFLKNSTLYQAVENIKPTLELRRVRKGGTTYQVPAIVSQKRQERLAIKWIIESAEKKNKKNKTSFSDCLLSEILEAFNKTGQPRQRRDEQLKIAEFNRAYTRYRWW